VEGFGLGGGIARRSICSIAESVRFGWLGGGDWPTGKAGWVKKGEARRKKTERNTEVFQVTWLGSPAEHLRIVEEKLESNKLKEGLR